MKGSIKDVTHRSVDGQCRGGAMWCLSSDSLKSQETMMCRAEYHRCDGYAVCSDKADESGCGKN
jgi:Pyruvate/2-oxoacid:ferredoxin oxidoreductase delta subunit